jgi:hypothetical protein
MAALVKKGDDSWSSDMDGKPQSEEGLDGLAIAADGKSDGRRLQVGSLMQRRSCCE